MSSSTAEVQCPQFRVEQLRLSSGTPLGAGAISQVVASTLDSPSYPGLPIAVKILSKLQLLQQNKVQCAFDEKAALVALAPHPFIARIYGTAQSEDELYFVMEHLPHGDLLQHTRRAAHRRLLEYNGRAVPPPPPPPPPPGKPHATPNADDAEELDFDHVDMNASSSSSSCSPAADGDAVGKQESAPNKAAEAFDEEEDDLEAHLARMAQREAERLAAATGTAGGAGPEGGALPPLRAIPPESPALRCLDYSDIQLITAQLVLALARVAARGFVLRDLKPENAAFDDHYRLCLIDFDTVDVAGAAHPPVTNHGVALPDERKRRDAAASTTATATAAAGDDDNKGESGGRPATAPARRRLTVSDIQQMRRKTSSFCGTAQYVSPEMVGECVWSFSSDLWALGTVVYEMLYGTHMFGGNTAFEVLRKVVRGADVAAAGVAFPYVKLTTPTAERRAAGADADPENTEGVSPPPPPPGMEDPFARVKDFILSLVCVDPVTRLGVRRARSGTANGANAKGGANTEDAVGFDLEALQAHPLFYGFDWSVLQRHVDGFRARPFFTSPSGANGGSATSASASAAAAADSRAAQVAEFEAASAALPSLRPLYQLVPFNSKRYADYVYRATADVNPFEQLLMTAAAGGTAGASGAADDDATAATKTTTTTATAEAKRSNANTGGGADDKDEGNGANGGESDSEGSVEIVDDVGMHYTGNHAPEEFQS